MHSVFNQVELLSIAEINVVYMRCVEVSNRDGYDLRNELLLPCTI
jgi:hypothetical protein